MSNLPTPDPRPHLNIVFIGHVDAGKSTTCGRILVLSGQIDDRTIEKYEKEAISKNRDSWYLAYIMDTSEDERVKGITVEVGKAFFETKNRRYTILDAPGHRNFVPNMIAGASQADIGVLLISARRGEFEAGFERGGQTREHVLLSKTLGIFKLIVAINKMDEGTVNWTEERFQEIVSKLKPFLMASGYRPDDVTFIPVSGLKGENLRDRSTDPRASWYTGPTLFEVLDSGKMPPRDADGPLRIPIQEGYKDMGIVYVAGKIEQGRVSSGDKIVLMPGNYKGEVQSVYIEEDEVAFATVGENIRLRLKNIEEEMIHKGQVLSSLASPCQPACAFEAKFHVMDLLEHRPILSAGYQAVLHCHSMTEECVIVKISEAMDLATKTAKVNPRFVKNNVLISCVVQLCNYSCIETYEKSPQLGRFTIRDEGKTIGVGKITKIVTGAKPYGRGENDAQKRDDPSSSAPQVGDQ